MSGVHVVFVHVVQKELALSEVVYGVDWVVANKYGSCSWKLVCLRALPEGVLVSAGWTVPGGPGPGVDGDHATVGVSCVDEDKYYMFELWTTAAWRCGLVGSTPKRSTSWKC